MFKKMLERTDPYQLSGFLMEGAEHPGNAEGSCSEQVRAAQGEILAMLRTLCEGRDDFDELSSKLFAQIGVCQQNYFEQGMEAGARIVLGLLDTKE